MKVNIIEAMQDYQNAVLKFQKSVKEMITMELPDAEWVVFVHSIFYDDVIPISVWKKNVPLDSPDVPSMDFRVSQKGIEEKIEGNRKYSEDQIEIVRKAILQVLNGDKRATNKFADIPQSAKKDFIDEEIERIESKARSK